MATVLLEDDYLQPVADEYGEPVLGAAPEPDPIQKLLILANSRGDISGAWTDADLITLGQDCCADYDRDIADRAEWTKIVEKAQASAAQESRADKNYPWAKASNVHYPLLTVAALQFNARAYPAIVKGDEAISVKVVGKDKGRPQIGPDGQPAMQMQPDPQTGQPAPVTDAQGQPVPIWSVPPGTKTARANRVKDYLNTTLFYRMEDWESDTDALLMDLPIVGCAFRKIWYDQGTRKQRAALVSALRIVVPMGARSCDTTPRLTEEIPDVYPHQIRQRMRDGTYRTVDLAPTGEDKDAGRKLIEQHRLIDLDDDGLDEPYVVTVDYETQKVLRVEANFSAADVDMEEGESGPRVLAIKRGKFFVKYDFFPHPQGKFYGIGLGHLLEQIGSVINTSINQLVDAGHAQIAGGGFIASGLRLQGNGRRSDLRFRPGEYKTVNGVTGSAIRDAIYERTFPAPSPVMVQVLDMMLAAARDISSVKDVITGDASNNGQVGTTLALIEQGLQVFTAIYKRVYRSLREEYALLYENIGKFGGDLAAEDYAEVLDDPAADFAADFQSKDMDIRPVSDPQSVTRMQQVAKAQALFQIGNQNPVYDQRELNLRVAEAMDVEDVEKLIPPPPPPAPPPPDVIAKANRDQAAAHKDSALAAKTEAETVPLAFNNGVMMGATNGGTDTGGISGVAGGPGDALGVPGGEQLPGFAA